MSRAIITLDGMGQAPPGDVRTRVVDAAEECFQRFGVAKTTIEDIASGAGLSRATIYRAFEGGRDEIILAVILREATRFLDRLRKRLDPQQGLPTAAIEGVLFTLRTVRENPTLALLFAPEVAGHTGAVAGASQALFDLVREFLRPLLEQARTAGELRPEIELDEAGEFLERIVISLLTVPPPVERSDDDVRRFLELFVLPALMPDTARVGITARALG